MKYIEIEQLEFNGHNIELLVKIVKKIHNPSHELYHNNGQH